MTLHFFKQRRAGTNLLENDKSIVFHFFLFSKYFDLDIFTNNVKIVLNDGPNKLIERFQTNSEYAIYLHFRNKLTDDFNSN